MSLPITDEDSLALLAFNIGNNQFDINRGLAYISMRDQVLRARTLINASMAAGMFAQRADTDDAVVDYDIAVLGAGVGGISVALAAVERKLRTIVIDRSDRCFALLRAGTDRLLSPTVYDWPARHFSVHEFPKLPGITGDGMSEEFILNFPSKPQQAASLANHLELQVEKIKKTQASRLKIVHGVTCSPTSIGWTAGRCLMLNPGVDLPRLDGTMARQVLARVVVYAFGFGSEKVMKKPEALISDTFWGYATIEDDLKALPASSTRGIVNIHGAGDGGLQEALRFAFGPDWQDLCAVVSELERHVIPQFPQWENSLRDIMLAEDNAARAYMWGYGQDLVFGPLDQVHQKFIDELLAGASPAVQEWFQVVGRRQDLVITNYDKHPVSGRVYALNRFLHKLLITFTARSNSAVLVKRDDGDMPKLPGAIEVDRSGLAQIEGALGTASKSDYLRRATLRAIPNQYGVIR